MSSERVSGEQERTALGSQRSAVQAEGRLAVQRDASGKLIAGRRKKNTLVMLSGGIDSVYCLVKLLRETDDNVVAHHVHLVNRENRHRIESERCDAIVRYCRKHYRAFDYTQSLIDRRHLPVFGFDVIAVAGEVGAVCGSFQKAATHPIDRWMLGFCTEEKEERNADPTASGRRLHLKNVVAASCFPNDPPELFNFPLVSKQDELDYLGAELSATCWFCREPVYDAAGRASECGRCKTCVLMADVRKRAADRFMTRQMDQEITG